MKRLTEAHLRSDDLTVVNAACSWYASFWRTTVPSDMYYQTYSLVARCG